MLVNPIGSDNNHEEIHLEINDPLLLGSNVTLIDESGNKYTFALEESIVIPQSTSLSLNNSGDTLSLLDNKETELDRVQYTHASEGKYLQF